MEEIWKDCVFEGYLISNLGRLKTISTGYISEGSKTAKGYMRVTHTPKSVFIHRLVACAFCENPNNYNEVDHLNFNRKDNKAVNLE